MSPRSKSSKMTDEHKQKLAEGREQGRKVRAYLEALEANKPKRGRPRTRESIEQRLAKIEAALPAASAIDRLALIQERLDLAAELDSFDEATDLAPLEDDFVTVAAAYSERKKISYKAWREIGVSAAVLKRAGISRSTS